MGGVQQHQIIMNMCACLPACSHSVSLVSEISTMQTAGPRSTARASSSARCIQRIQKTRKSSAVSVSREGAQQRSAVIILPGFLSNHFEYEEMEANLRELGHPLVETVPVTFKDWLPTLTGGSFSWYISKVAQAVQRVHADHGQVSLVGVSAGGWIARLALGSYPYEGRVWGLAPQVQTLVTLGTPHLSLEDYPFGRTKERWLQTAVLPEPVKQATAVAVQTAVTAAASASTPAGPSSSSSSSSGTGSQQQQRQRAEVSSAAEELTTSLQYTNCYYPDASSVGPTRVVCVVGNCMKGRPCGLGSWAGMVLSGSSSLQEANDTLMAATSYKANCGTEDVEGDGVCPVQTALLPGAEQLVLAGVWHNQEEGKLWYGSKEAVELWDKCLP